MEEELQRPRPLFSRQSQDPPPTMELAVLVLRDLLEYSCQLPELARDISTNHIPGLLTSLLALKPEVRPPPSAGAPWKWRALPKSPPPMAKCSGLPVLPSLGAVPAVRSGRKQSVHDLLSPGMWLLASKCFFYFGSGGGTGCCLDPH